MELYVECTTYILHETFRLSIHLHSAEYTVKFWKIHEQSL